MILQKFIVYIDRKHFLLEAVLQSPPESHSEGTSRKEASDHGGQQSTLHRVKQEWRLGEGPYYELSQGKEWSACQLNLGFILPLNESVIGSGCLARGLKDKKDWETVEKVSLRVHPNCIDVLFTVCEKADVFLRYSWDEYSQLTAPQVIAGNLEDVPSSLQESVQQGCYGRFGLLSRSMANARKVEDPIDDMGALRWA